MKLDNSHYHLEKSKTLKNLQINSYWNCDHSDSSGCKARLITTAVDNSRHRIIERKGNHSHEVSSITASVKRAGLLLASRSRNAAERAIDIVSDTRTSVPIVVQQSLPESNSLKRRVHRN
uniref:FLYWCH-type domain-containing protein n=1 Tax=Panagrolaimus superbus TaxID=310955 RepID=A0A914YDV6_9BILA